MISESASSIAKKETKHLSLDKFMRTHTSEDNESFYELMEESQAGNFFREMSSILVYKKNACLVFLLYLDDVTNAI